MPPSQGNAPERQREDAAAPWQFPASQRVPTRNRVTQYLDTSLPVPEL